MKTTGAKIFPSVRLISAAYQIPRRLRTAPPFLKRAGANSVQFLPSLVKRVAPQSRVICSPWGWLTREHTPTAQVEFIVNKICLGL